ncbi:MAG: hypothetical protein KF767_02020 [Bdellovibrionaceae bacterium]|nr:hypothetical protein [Pseudobdellovibrionaceae bacterium]
MKRLGEYQGFLSALLRSMVERFEFQSDDDMTELMREPRLMVVLNHGTPISWVPPICLLTEKAVDHGGDDRISRGIIDKFFYSNPITQPIAEYVTQSPTPQSFDELLEQFRSVERTDLVVFPEGAMTFFGDVSEIQPFRSPRFLEIAIRAEAPLLVAIHRGTEEWNLRLPLPLELIQTVSMFSKFFGAKLQEDAQINLPVRLRKVPNFRMRVQKYVPELKASDLAEDLTERRAQLQLEADRLRTRMQELFDSLA